MSELIIELLYLTVVALVFPYVLCSIFELLLEQIKKRKKEKCNSIHTAASSDPAEQQKEL